MSRTGKPRMKRLFNSMYARMFMTMLMVTLIPMILMQVFYTNYIIKVIRENRIDIVRDYCSIIADDMLETGYLDDNASDVIDDEISQFCNLYDGRAIVTDSDYEVKLDTFGSLQGMQLVCEETIKAMQGIEISQYYRSSDQICLTYVIRKNDVDRESTVGDSANSSSSQVAVSGAGGETAQTSSAISEENIDGMVLFIVSCADLTRVAHNIVRTMTYIVVGVGLILTLLSYLLSKRFTNPFNSMARSINRISEGSFDEELHLTGFNEIEQISDAFNSMMAKLRNLENSRQEFVSNVSHELKTPLTSMKVLADSINMQPDAPVELYREFMQDITVEIDRETEIINDLLSLVKMDKTKSDLVVADTNINEMLEAVIKRLRPIAAKRNVTMQLETKVQVNAQVDEIKLSLAISNLAENAIKYNIASGWVHVSLDADDSYFFITVADSGIGIPPEAQEKIFERFYRVDKARSRENGGTGLGLAITKTVIQMHHGAIKVSSKEDEGTTFSVRIPLVYTKEKEEP